MNPTLATYPTLSVVIPLYNKEREIARTLQSVLSQELPPLEIVVVDDGSTDGSVAQVEQFDSPLIRLIRQENGGVSSARNRGVQEARGEYICLLDGDDLWKAHYTRQVSELIVKYPNCGLYCVGFEVSREQGVFPNSTGEEEGIVQNYFTKSMHKMLTHTSSTTIPRSVYLASGGFPLGMKLGEDQYLWTVIARDHQLCYSPRICATFNLCASNRSAHRYRMEQTEYAFRTLYDPARPDINEYIARCEIGRAILFTTQGYTTEALAIEHFYSYTTTYRYGWWKLRVLNRLPASWRAPLMRLYKRLAWLVSRKGLFEE